MSLHQPSRGIQELLYTLGTSLERFKSIDGLQHLVKTGKLSLLSLLGLFERTKDEVYERRATALSETRRCLLQLVSDLEEVADSSDKLARKINRLIDTLEHFHRCCDMEIDDRIGSEDPNVQQLRQDFRQIREANSQLKSSLEDFSASRVTCTDMTRSAITEIEKVSAETASDVAAALADFDDQCRRVQMKENEVAHVMSRATSREDPAVHFAEFSYVKELELLDSLDRKYIDSLGNAMKATHFTLEQPSMTGWVSSNVFFAQLGHLLGDISASGKTIAVCLLSIKNAQKVSHQLTEEKQRILQEQRTSPDAPDVGTSTATKLLAEGPSAVTGASSVHLHRDDPSLPFPLADTSRAQLPAREGSPPEGPTRRFSNLDDLFN
ncbi:hypothetical protein LSCM1_04520 [Leishmania martiniquensis]|uniref:Uncharacterized protein n=1 Tax=Leishmania martiniquensis TaxID=1580590 RepID=A0A836KKF6_9TRYP|nr:hypothetical protein LSCM1_04520 [Leishmania martiniquensis]